MADSGSAVSDISGAQASSIHKVLPFHPRATVASWPWNAIPAPGITCHRGLEEGRWGVPASSPVPFVRKLGSGSSPVYFHLCFTGQNCITDDQGKGGLESEM